MSLYKYMSRCRLGTALFGLVPAFCLLSLAAITPAAESDLDASYLPVVNNVVFSIALQPDGKAIIGGNFTTANGQTRNYVARINLNGTTDTTFPVDTMDRTVTQVLLQSDGKILVTGGFGLFNGVAHNRIVRLNSDGTVDSTFNSTVGANNTILAAALQSDGKILIGGDFTTYNGTARTNLARLNSDGSLDTTFNSTIVPATSSGVMRVIVPQADGSIYLGGGFSSVGGATRNCTARINANGSLDTTFAPLSSSSFCFTESILPLASGQILVGGSFNVFSGPPSRNGLARLNADGTTDTTFNANLGQSSIVYKVLPQATGKILLIGSLSLTVNSVIRRGIVRINPDGTSDDAFNVNVGSNGTINTAALQSDGKILIGGQFASYNGVDQPTLARLVGTPMTAAGVSVSGRLVTAEGRGIRNAKIMLTESDGTAHSIISGPRGFFSFDDITAGQACIITANARRFRFDAPTRVVYLTDNLEGMDFVALQDGLVDKIPRSKILPIDRSKTRR